MDTPDISKLAIDRSATPVRRRRRRWWPWVAALAVLIAGVSAYLGVLGRPPSVETVAVTTAYPSQGGWVLGLGLASLMQLVHISTMNWQSFSELAFSFTLTPKIVAQSLVFAAVMGFAGGVLPALRASRLKIVDALRAA